MVRSNVLPVEWNIWYRFSPVHDDSESYLEQNQEEETGRGEMPFGAQRKILTSDKHRSPEEAK